MVKKCSLLLTLLLILGLLGGLSVSAAIECPPMPKGAKNLFKPDTMSLLDEKLLAFYENDTLLTDGHTSNTDYKSLTAAFAFDKDMEDDYVISFFIRIPAGNTSDQYSVRIFDDGEGSYCDVTVSAQMAQLYSSVGAVNNFTLPSTGKCLATNPASHVLGEWKNFQIYVRPGDWQTDISLFVDGEAMTTNGRDTVSTPNIPTSLMFGGNAAFSVRGIRVYKVDPKATSFEKPFDPNAAFTVDAPNGVDGDNGGTGATTIPKTTTTAAGHHTTQVNNQPDTPSSPANLGLILGIASGAVAAATVAAIVVWLILKKKKPTDTPDESVEKEGDDQ